MDAAASLIGEIKEYIKMQFATLFMQLPKDTTSHFLCREWFTDLQIRREEGQNPRMWVLEG